MGHNHPSKGEADYCEKLHLVLNSGVHNLEKIVYEESYDLIVNGMLICKHKPDWTLYSVKGVKTVVEFKGFEKPDWKLKKKLFTAIYPNIEYNVVKKNDR